MNQFKWISCSILFLLYVVVPGIQCLRENTELPCRHTENVRGLTSRHYRGYCYWFTKYATATWYDAQQSCNRTFTVLTSIHSFEELTFLKNMITVNDRGSHIYWIGMRARGIDSVYEWEDGTPVDFVNWKNDEFSQGNSDVGTCAYLDPATGFFGRKNCNETHFFVCKTEDVPLTTTTPFTTTTNLPEVCPDNWHTFGDKCYGIFGLHENDKKTWTEADNECVDMGATLMSVHSREEQDFLYLMMRDKSDSTWTGFRESQSETDRAFHWSDNSPVTYTNWDRYQPNNWNGKKEECVNMRFSSPHFGKWNDAECDVMKQSYICQIHIDPKKAKFAEDTDFCTEPKDWMKLNTSCYRIFNESENNVKWSQAQSYCNNSGGNLVSVLSLRETTFLRFHLAGLQGRFWIGMRNEGTHDRYAWISGPATYSNWDRGEPKEIPNKSNCVATNSHGRWSVQDCNENYPFICEVIKNDSNTPTAAPEEPGTEMVCPSGSRRWTDYGGPFCYIVEMNDQITWFEAVQRCFREDGFLASFHSIEEVGMIIPQTADHGNPLYIGLGKKHDGGFGWIDGSAVDFVNWETGQPSSKTQACVEMLARSGTWNDIACELKRGYICSVPKTVSSTGNSTPSAAPLIRDEKGENGISVGGIIAICLGVMILIAISVATYCYLYPSMRSVTRLTELKSV